jgi:hypothetical protein
MSDPIARAFATIPVPEPGPALDRRVLARLAPVQRARMRQARRVMVVYWVAALVASGVAIADMSGSMTDTLVGCAALGTVLTASLVTAGGVRNLARALRLTYRET